MEFCQALVVRALVALAIALAAGPARAADPKAEIKPALGHATASPVPPNVAAPSPVAVVTPTPPPAAVEGMIERGAYLAWIGGCHDCHTPLKVGANGPEPDMDRLLSGHPEDLKMPAPTLPAAPWSGLSSTTNTAFAGPWGLSYASNLTPDPDTGMGAWTEKIFVDTMRSGRHWGAARPILPPMPWRNVARLSDDDLRSLYRYLTSIPPIKNRVPDSVPAAAPAAKP